MFTEDEEGSIRDEIVIVGNRAMGIRPSEPVGGATHDGLFPALKASVAHPLQRNVNGIFSSEVASM